MSRKTTEQNKLCPTPIEKYNFTYTKVTYTTGNPHKGYKQFDTIDTRASISVNALL